MELSLTSEQIQKLKKGLEQCILKSTSTERTSSLVLTASGREYVGAVIGSDTNLMHISSEHSALALSISANDFPVREVVTMIESEQDFLLSPVVVKVMVDYTSRSQAPLSYRVVDKEGKTLFQSENVEDIFPLYNPAPISISRTKEPYSPNKVKEEISPDDMPKELKKFALMGMGRNFPLYDSASSYGTAVYTSTGHVYFAGQYSSPDKRLNLHSEMTAMISAILDEGGKIESIGVVSNKYPDSPCNMCGSCRQFVSEMSAKLNISPDLYLFSSESSEFKKIKIEEYLPDSWSSKKWI